MITNNQQMESLATEILENLVAEHSSEHSPSGWYEKKNTA